MRGTLHHISYYPFVFLDNLLIFFLTALSKKTINKTVIITNINIPTIITADKAPVPTKFKCRSQGSWNFCNYSEKIINEIPFPIPLKVICSPSHIKKVVPATKDIVVVTLKYIQDQN